MAQILPRSGHFTVCPARWFPWPLHSCWTTARAIGEQPPCGQWSADCGASRESALGDRALLRVGDPRRPALRAPAAADRRVL